VLDVVLFVGILIASNPKVTGISLHEWLAAIIIAPALYHLVINWEWVVHAATRLAEKLKATSKLNFAVDVALFLATVAVMLSGFMVLPGMLTAASGAVVIRIWHETHRIASLLTLLTMVVHLALHARWMLDALVRTMTPAQHARPVRRRPPAGRSTAPARSGVNR
jgi:hypothetical protein